MAGLAVTAFICHVGYEVTADVIRRLADGIDPAVITDDETAAGSRPACYTPTLANAGNPNQVP